MEYAAKKSLQIEIRLTIFRVGPRSTPHDTPSTTLWSSAESLAGPQSDEFGFGPQDVNAAPSSYGDC